MDVNVQSDYAFSAVLSCQQDEHGAGRDFAAFGARLRTFAARRGARLLEWVEARFALLLGHLLGLGIGLGLLNGRLALGSPHAYAKQA